MDKLSLHKMSLAELRGLRREQFSSLSTDALECLLARMGVALSLKERNNKEYYLHKLMELIAELIESKSRPSFRPTAPNPNLSQGYIYPSASYSFVPSPLAGFSPTKRNFQPFDNNSPSAPPLLMLPPFSSPEQRSLNSDITTPTMYKYDTHTTISRRIRPESPPPNISKRMKYRPKMIVEEKQEDRRRLTVLFPPRISRKNSGVDDFLRSLCFRLFCLAACLTPIVLALIIFFALGKDPLLSGILILSFLSFRNIKIR